MIISPPHLPPRIAGTKDIEFVASGMPVAAINCPGTAIPEGSFPISLNLGWHGGVHVHAPTLGSIPLAVRAIADGEIVFARKPTTPVMDAKHPQNYNPYGGGAKWTDNGMIILRHTTDIGEGTNAESIVFYSILMHLSELRGNALKVANGSASPAERRIFRKDTLGMAGRIYGAADHVHFEIVCDDVHCRKLIGRRSGVVDLAHDGRQDAIYGELYFHLPPGTRFYTEQPKANTVNPLVAPAYTSVDSICVGLRHANGEGADEHRGDCYLTTYRLDGNIVGDVMEDHEADYQRYSRAITIADEFPAESRPAPTVVYELLRFGRYISGSAESANPLTCPHWRYVSYGTGKGWVNLNEKGVTKYSDADFPQWKLWEIIDDDVDGNSQANSVKLIKIIKKSINSERSLNRRDLMKASEKKDVRDAFQRLICKFPSEWNRNTVDARWGWLQSDEEVKLTGEDWTQFRDHVMALAVETSALPEVLRDSHWHFHPFEFICHFRKCQWLSMSEFKQLFPSQAVRRHSGAYLWEAVSVNLANNNSIAAKYRVALNKTARKYGITSPLRLASFFGNALQETLWSSTLSESGGEASWYSPWFGRGYLQLTHATNYIEYWRFRGRSVPEALKTCFRNAMGSRSKINLQDNLFPQLTQQMRSWREEVGGVQMPNSQDSLHAPADSAGFYWAMLKMAGHADRDHVLQRVSIQTNHGPKVFYRSPSFWRATAAVNLPAAINTLYSPALNGFESRCVAYSYALAVLSELYFPNNSGALSLEFPEGYSPRRN